VYIFTTILEKVGGDIVRTESCVHAKLETILANIIRAEGGRFSHIGMWRDVIKILMYMMFVFDII
jgi:hypothetical protein